MRLDSPKLAFFRQSGWMVIATTLGGVCMFAVHTPASRGMSIPEYGVFTALLQVINLMLIPAIGLQTVLAQQAAEAVDPARRRQLAGLVRGLLMALAVVWLVMAVGAMILRQDLLQTLKIAHPACLYLTIVIGLLMLWVPVVQGLLQGLQNFQWLGWVQVFNGCGRFAGVVVFVTVMGWQAAGGLVAVLGGFVVAAALAAWHTRAAWLGEGAPVEWRAWLGRVIPLTLGLGAVQFMMSADQILVQGVFEPTVTGFYGAAGMIGRALVFFTVPMLSVMFPKIVASAAKAERTDVLALALGATAALGGCAAVACTVVPWLPLRIVYFTREEYWRVAPLVPWFAWCMLPLTLSNVLIGNLLARSRFAAVPWLVLVAGAYGAALMGRAGTFQEMETAERLRSMHVLLRPAGFAMTPLLVLGPPIQAFKQVVQTIGGFSTLLLAVAAWFTWVKRPPAATP